MSKFLDIQNHCFKLCEFLHWHEINVYGFARDDLLKLIEMSSMVKEVIPDDSFQNRSLKDIFPDVGEYDKMIFSQISKSLLIFTFIYSAIEMLIDCLNLDPIPDNIVLNKNDRTGKINKACYFLKENYRNKELLEGYETLLDKLKELLQTTAYPLRNKTIDISSYFNGANFISKAGLGLFVIYKIRNKFSHGSYIFDNYDTSYSEPFTPNILNISTQLLLLTIQMILIITESNDAEKVKKLKCLHLHI